MKISIIGTEYSGIATAAAICDKNEITLLANGEPESDDLHFVKDEGITKITECITYNIEEALSGADIVFICLPISYDRELNLYDLHDIQMYISKIVNYAPKALVVIRSDVPVGYTERIMGRYPNLRVVFCPDFSRKGRAVFDALNPSRVVIGGGSDSECTQISELLAVNNCDVIHTGISEAESIKLFANSYLAMRVAYFNEIDTFAEIRGLNSKDIIRAVSLDNRIGDLYNNPSFGYGGRYLVEGTCRLRNDYSDFSDRIIKTVDICNEERKNHIAKMIMRYKPEVCGIYRLGMKTGSKDFMYSAVEGIIRRLQAGGVHVIIFEPAIKIERFLSADIVNDFGAFCEMSDLIVANRVDEKVKLAGDKLYTRDLFERD